jgi:hypothetical protein
VGIVVTIVRETRTGLLALTAAFVGQIKRLDPALPQQIHQISHKHICLLATYREALAATSVLYQVLCLYRVAEGGDSNAFGPRKAKIPYFFSILEKLVPGGETEESTAAGPPG